MIVGCRETIIDEDKGNDSNQDITDATKDPLTSFARFRGKYIDDDVALFPEDPGRAKKGEIQKHDFRHFGCPDEGGSEEISQKNIAADDDHQAGHEDAGDKDEDRVNPSNDALKFLKESVSHVHSPLIHREETPQTSPLL